MVDPLDVVYAWDRRYGRAAAGRDQHLLRGERRVADVHRVCVDERRLARIHAVAGIAQQLHPAVLVAPQ